MKNWNNKILIERSLAESIINNLISSEAFYNAAKLNWKCNKGVEEELYPYFNEIIRKQLVEYLPNDNIVGIGWGKIHRIPEKIDCIVYLSFNSQRITFAIELKGPSKDRKWIQEGLTSDFNKLRKLKLCGFIQHGLVIGVYLLDNNNFERINQINEEKFDFYKILDIDFSQVKVAAKWRVI